MKNIPSDYSILFLSDALQAIPDTLDNLTHGVQGTMFALLPGGLVL